ncbi:MAG: hypothetical protein WAM66_05580 [Acidobacteriaceae bacterium]
MSRKPWDLGSTHALEGAAEWIRKRSDAIVVMVVRGGDVAFAVAEDGAPSDADVVVRGADFAFAVAEDCAPSDAAELVRELLPEMVEATNRARAATRDAQTRKRAASIAGHNVV